MALDKNGRPIPVYVPPPPPPPGTMPPNQPIPHLENDVNLLKGAVEQLNARFNRIEGFAAEVATLAQRVLSVENADAQFGQALARFGVVEEAMGDIAKLVERITKLEQIQATYDAAATMVHQRLDSLEKQLFAAQERGDVDPVPPA